VQEFVVKAFLLEVTRTQRPRESMRNPTWFGAEEARKTLAKGREVKYAAELRGVIDRALEHIGGEKALMPDYPDSRAPRVILPT